MNSDKMTFYVAVIAILCVSVLITHCTYQTADCKREAIKANVKVEDIATLCRM